MEKWIRTLRRFARNKRAISGLETAIVLIAFVIVASAFAYAVLNMGFLATQKSQQVVMGGLQAASAAIVLDGPVYGYSSQTGSAANVTTVIFWLKVAAGAESVDLNINKTTIAFQDPRGVWPNIYNSAANLTYTVNTVYFVAAYTGKDSAGNTNSACKVEWEVGSGNLLDKNEKVRVTIDLFALATSKDLGATGTANILTDKYPAGWISNNENFKVLIKPPTGSVLEVDRYAPPQILPVNDLG